MVDTQPFKVVTDEEYECTLTEDSLKKAKEELNEDPKERLNIVKQLREWIEQQPHITFNADTVLLLSFLRTAKFSQLRVRKMIDGYVTALHNHKSFFESIDTHDPGIQAIIDSGSVVPLPKRNKHGHRMMLFRIGKIDTKTTKYNFIDEIRCHTVMGSLTGRDENTIVNGTVFVMDCTGMSLKHVTRSSNDEMRRWHKAIQHNFPGRFKAFHYYNAGALFETIMVFARPFLSKKFQDRIKVHETAESLYKAVGMELLPLEYLPDDYKGPNIGTCDEIVANFKTRVMQEDFRQFLLRNTSEDAVKLDVSKRPSEIPQESFRKLNVD